jgi:hypothetical protein
VTLVGSITIALDASAVRWCAGLAPAFERLDDDHVSATAWTWWADIERLFRHVVIGGRRDGE